MAKTAKHMIDVERVVPGLYRATDKNGVVFRLTRMSGAPDGSERGTMWVSLRSSDNHATAYERTLTALRETLWASCTFPEPQ